MTAPSDIIHPVATEVILQPPDNERLANLCGPLDDNLRQIERRLGVEINNRGNTFRIIGTPKSVEIANRLLNDLYDSTRQEVLSSDRVHLYLQDTSFDEELESELEKEATIKTRRGLIKGRSPNQRLYLQNMLTHDISFGIGPAGTGKTYLAVAAAIDALNKKKVKRIILARPAVEAGERLGFLPGTLQEKVDPYLRPLYDALYDVLDPERTERMIEKGTIEIAPIAFMRGRTLNDAFVILDEAQNTTSEQMKMFLTRLGFNSKAVITGDITQVDLPEGRRSGLMEAVDVVRGVLGISFVYFTEHDVVRHQLVQRIIRAYEEYDQARTTAETVRRSL